MKLRYAIAFAIAAGSFGAIAGLMLGYYVGVCDGWLIGVGDCVGQFGSYGITYNIIGDTGHISLYGIDVLTRDLWVTAFA